MKPVSYWADSAPPIPSYAGRPLPERADAVVIGGGYTGLSTAVHLGRKGAHVVVLERGRLGSGASSRNGGHCNNGITVKPGPAIARFGVDRARRLFQVSVDAVDYVEKLVRTEGIDCEFRRAGRLALAFKPAHVEQLRSYRELARRQFGFETELIPRAELGREIGSRYYHGGLLDPRSAALHPGKYVGGLVQAAGRAGADLHEDTAALAIRRDGGAFVVTTTRGPVRAGQVMLATDGYTDRVHRELQRRILPVGSFVIASAPLPENLARAVSPGRRNMVDTKNYSYYFRLSEDNRLIFGGRARFALSTPESDRGSAQILARGMTTVFPQLAGVPIEYCWGGTVGFTMDRLPHAGEMDGVFYALGYCGHGVQMATYLGKCMAEVMDGHPEANPWGDLPFPKPPLVYNTPWYLPVAGAYFKVMDWLA
jgi:glycine/D-amino acid oxidase-like deaminating enzyme